MYFSYWRCEKDNSMLIVLNTWYYWITIVIHFLNHQCTYKRVQQIEIPKYTARPSSHCCTIYVKLFRCQNFPIPFPVLFQFRVFCGAFCLPNTNHFTLKLIYFGIVISTVWVACFAEELDTIVHTEVQCPLCNRDLIYF